MQTMIPKTLFSRFLIIIIIPVILMQISLVYFFTQKHWGDISMIMSDSLARDVAIIVDNYKVEVIRLSDFLKDNTNIGFDVLKIDVEGHELQCLQGLFQEESGVLPIRFIQLESHNDDMYLNNNQHQEIENILFKNDFEKCITIKHGFGDFAEIIYENKSK